MANQTILESEGALMLKPIYQLLFGQDYESNYYLALARDQVKISYKSYKSDNLADMQTIFDQKLTPGRKR